MAVSSLSGKNFLILESPLEGEPDCVTQFLLGLVYFQYLPILKILFI